MEQLLDREEVLAIQRLTDSVQHLAEDVSAVAQAGPRIRRHPFLATGLAALLGYIAGPLAVRGLVRLLRAAPGLSGAGAAHVHGLTGIALASLRFVSGRR